MNEVNINIEGFNVNGICVGCLHYNRKMFFSDKIKECFRLLGNIEIPDGLEVQVCWECYANITKVLTFQKRIQNAFSILLDYSTKHMFLDSHADLSQHACETLSKHIVSLEINKTCEGDIKEIKEENFDDGFRDADEFQNADQFLNVDEFQIADKFQNANELGEYDIKTNDLPVKNVEEATKEINIKFENTDELDKVQDIKVDIIPGSSDDDIQLSKLKKKKGKKAHKKRKNTEDIKIFRKLKNLPKGIVEMMVLSEQKMWEIRGKDVVDPDFVGLKYKCVDCIIGFSMLKLMEHHFNGRHTPKNNQSFQCDVCKSFFLTKENLAVHRPIHLFGYRCKLCMYETGLKRLIVKHVNTHHKGIIGQYACGNCNKEFSSKSRLIYHKGVCIQEDKPQCDCCGKVFANKTTLKYHLKNISAPVKKEKRKEELCLPCKGCNKVFDTRKGYRAHVVIHEGVQFPCPVCGKLFQWKRNLARHIRNHSERDTGLVYECAPCRKRFSSKDCFNNHMKFSKKHVSEDNYLHQCTYCGKKFPTKWCMVDHIDWDHLKKIKYQCQTCLKAFKTAKIMVAHINNLHRKKNKKNEDSETEHLCDICGKSYTSVKRLKGHVWAMHTHRSTSKSYKCALCPATFMWQTSIYKHTKMMHDSKRNKTIPSAKTKSRMELYEGAQSYAMGPYQIRQV